MTAPPRRVRVLLSIDADDVPAESEAARSALAAMRMDAVAPGSSEFDIFVGVYADRYGAIDPSLGVSSLEHDYLAAGRRPRLVYVVPGSGNRDEHLALLLSRIQADDLTSYRRVASATELGELLADDLAILLTEAFTGEETATVESAGPALDVPVIHQPPAARARIPAMWHRLVGRDREVATISRLIDGGCRLLTVTGPGGIGKSRLAIEVGLQEQDQQPDGAWFVDLAGVRDPALLGSAIAHSLGIRESAGVNPVESLKSYLAPMSMLLLLDSFEAVTAAAPVVVDLLSAAPGVKILVTSRSVLRVRGEQEYPLQPLAVPAVGPIDPAQAGPALELFLERAAAANPGRRFDGRELLASAEICRRIDGVPLAIELAAARTRLLPPTVLLSRLEHALDVLSDGPLDLPERQRTLRRTLDWDHALLGIEEQLLFRRLSVFPREFTLAGAEAVAGDVGVDVIEGVDSLVGKSLLRQLPADLRNEPLFIMLQVVHDYGFERLEEAGEADEAQDRHARYALSRAERAGSAPPSEAEGWLATLEAEHSDLRAALNWADRSMNVEILLRLAAALGAFWRAHCHFSEGRRWLDRALSLSVGQRTETRVDLLNAAAFLARARGDYDTADGQYREALAIREEMGELNKVAGSQRFIGNVAYDRGDLDEAEKWWRLSLATLEGTGDESRRMSVLNNLGIVAHHRGDDEAALALYDETTAYADKLGAAEHIARAQMNKASALSFMGMLDEAIECARTAVRIYFALDDTWDVVDALDVLAGALGRDGQVEEAGWILGGSNTLRSALDVRRPVCEQKDYDIGYGIGRDKDPEAFDLAYQEGSAASLPAIIDRALGVEGDQ